MMRWVDPVWERGSNFVFNATVKYALRMAAYENDKKAAPDSAHVLKIDEDVPFFCLEILPQLQSGVIIHFHDRSFPYNIPCPL